jgi:two-component system KDP operon response regulator KdpE
VIDLDQRRVTYDGRPVHLSRTEYRLLALFAEHPGKLLTHREILAAVWGTAYVDDVDYVRMCVRSVRTKIEPDPAHPTYLLTEYGCGYRLCEPRGQTAPLTAL